MMAGVVGARRGGKLAPMKRRGATKQAGRAARPLGEVRETLSEAGLRKTAARIAVLQQLQSATTPVTHGEIADALTDSGFDRATVYRNLMDLTEAGLVTRSDLGDHVWRFELKGGSESHGAAHPHFVCVDCGEIACLPGGAVRIVASRGMPRSVGKSGVEVQLKGRCDACAGS
jgi:Fur family ferric uptake transcriptional regulator